MNIKSLLLGSAAAAVAATGAQAADAIIIAEPEPMEYVRICDTYGVGFFYIPGTETCLRIGGYVRYQMEYTDIDGVGDTFGKFARFAPNFDARNETEWGTLRSFAEVEFNWASDGAFTRGPGQGTNLAHAFISLENGPHTFLVGKTDTPYHATSNAGWNAGGIFLGNKGNNGNTNTGVVQYTFNAGNGFDFTLAAVEGTTDQFDPNLEAIVRYSQGWGRVMGAVGYDNDADEWGGKLGAEVNFAPVTLGAQVAYGSAPNSVYGARYADFDTADMTGGAVENFTSEWAVLGYARVAINDKLSAKLSAQWFDGETFVIDPALLPPIAAVEFKDAWQVTAGLDWRPVNGLQIIPEVRYTKLKAEGFNAAGASLGTDKADVWQAALRFNRTF